MLSNVSTHDPQMQVHSSSLSSLMLKYRSSYDVLLGATTRKKSRNCCAFRYFFDKYLRYRLEKGVSAFTWIFCLSREMATLSPKLPVLPSILMRALRNFSKSLVSRILSSAGCWQSIVNFKVCFLPFTTTFFFRPLTPIFERRGYAKLMLSPSAPCQWP